MNFKISKMVYQTALLQILRDLFLNAVTIWPVTGQGFQNTKSGPAVYILSKFLKIERF